MPVTELTPQQLGYFERGSAHTLKLKAKNKQKKKRGPFSAGVEASEASRDAGFDSLADIVRPIH